MTETTDVKDMHLSSDGTLRVVLASKEARERFLAAIRRLAAPGTTFEMLGDDGLLCRIAQRTRQ